MMCKLTKDYIIKEISIEKYSVRSTDENFWIHENIHRLKKYLQIYLF